MIFTVFSSRSRKSSSSRIKNRKTKANTLVNVDVPIKVFYRPQSCLCVHSRDDHELVGQYDQDENELNVNIFIRCASAEAHLSPACVCLRAAVTLAVLTRVEYVAVSRITWLAPQNDRCGHGSTVHAIALGIEYRSNIT